MLQRSRALSFKCILLRVFSKPCFTHNFGAQFWKGSWAICVNPKQINQFLEENAYKPPMLAVNPTCFRWAGPPGHSDSSNSSTAINSRRAKR